MEMWEVDQDELKQLTDEEKIFEIYTTTTTILNPV